MRSHLQALRSRWVIGILSVALLYYFGATLGLRLAFEKTNASPVWPSSGIALAAVLLLGYRIWPGIALGALLANVVGFLANQAASASTVLVVSAVISIGNTLEAMAGAFLLQRWVGAGNPFYRTQDGFTFTAVAFLACCVSPSVGTTSVSLAGIAPPAAYGAVWFTWWLGDTMGALLVTPLLLTWGGAPQTRSSVSRRVEAGLLFVSLLVASWVGFGGRLPGTEAQYPLAFLPIPWLVWAAFRFGPRGAASAAILTSAVAVWHTVHGVGPFVQSSVNESLLLLQAFVGIVAVTILTMAAAVAERRDAEARLRTAHDGLEARVEERTRELVQVNEQLRQAQKMEAIGRLAGGVAHDFNNLLSVVAGRSQLLLLHLAPHDPNRRDVELIQKSAERAAKLTRQLLAFSRKQVLAPKVVDLSAVVTAVEPFLRRLLGEDIELAVNSHEGLGRVRADPGQIEQVVLNLAINARDAMPRGGRLTIETTNVELDETYARHRAEVRPGPHVMLAVTDTGVGMDAATLARLFEPFFTTKEPGTGTGLGLATVYGIVKQSGGHVAGSSEAGHGATFKVYLPRIETALEARKGAPAAMPAARGSETVLLVEDEPDVRELAEDVLKTWGYTVLKAGDPVEALGLARRHDGPIHLLMTDLIMPGMDGRGLADRLLVDRPALKLLFISGYADALIIHHEGLDAGAPFLQKPFTPDALVRRVRDVLDKPPGSPDPSSG